MISLKNSFILLFSLFMLSCNSDNNNEDIAENTAKNTTEELDPNSLEAIEQFIIENPESPNGYSRRAYYYSQNLEMKKAIEDINRALAITPDVASLNFTKAEMLFNQAGLERNPLLYDQSEIYLDNTLKLDSTYVDAYILKAKINILKDAKEKAIGELSQAIKLSPTLSEPYFLKGLIYLDMGNLQLAQSSYQTALEMDGQSYDANAGLGYVYYLDTNATGLIYFDAAHELNPKAVEPLRNKGLLLINLGRPEEAIESFEQVLEIDSTFAEAHYNIGVCYVNSYRDDFEQAKKDSIVNEAIRHFDLATKIEPKYAIAWYNLGHSYEFIGDKKRALECYKKAIDIDPDFELVNEALRRF